jgi:hypothetical protein
MCNNVEKIKVDHVRNRVTLRNKKMSEMNKQKGLKDNINNKKVVKEY